MAHFHFAVAIAVLGLMALGIQGESRPAEDKSQLSHIFHIHHFTLTYLHFSALN